MTTATTDADLLAFVGKTLYGPHWQTELASDLYVTNRTVGRWASGKYPIPAKYLIALLPLCEARATLLVEARQKIETALAEKNSLHTTGK